jgi:drug/metabolite transporter (DMT)-like permease
MEAKLPARLGVAIMLIASVCFATNHIGARIAFDHGTSVATAVTVRAAGTALFLLILMRLQGVRIALQRATLLRLTLVGLLVAVQSYCLSSAVAIIPAGLALLVFQTCPLLFVLLSWATGKERPGPAAMLAIPLALAGLVLALDVRFGQLAERWADIGVGVSWAFGAAVSYAIVLFANAHWVKGVDGRLRTFVMTGVTATVVLIAAGAAGAHALPADRVGWIGLSILSVFYCVAMTTLFLTLHRLDGASGTVALNFEPIAVLVLAWIFLGQAVNPLQIAGAFLVVAAIVWLGAAKR